MNVETIEKGSWIFAERSLPGYFIYKLLEGKVSIFHSGTKIHEIEVKKGGKPQLVGMISTLRPDGLHIASVKAETDCQVQRIYSEQVRGILENEVPDATKKDIRTMIDAIVMRNDIEALQYKLKALPAVKFKTPDNLRDEVREVLESLNNLYMNPDVK